MDAISALGRRDKKELASFFCFCHIRTQEEIGTPEESSPQNLPMLLPDFRLPDPRVVRNKFVFFKPPYHLRYSVRLAVTDQLTWLPLLACRIPHQVVSSPILSMFTQSLCWVLLSSQTLNVGSSQVSVLSSFLCYHSLKYIFH